MPRSTSLPLPKGWTKIVRTGALHAISLAATALTVAWARAATSRSSRRWQSADADRLRTEVALLTEELGLKDTRWARVPARRRPYYGPLQRMRVLELQAARGWSAKQTADRFLVTEETIASWMRRLRATCRFVRCTRPREVVVAADADAVGRMGAERLADALLTEVSSVRVITPPLERTDMRDWVRNGAAATDVLAASKAARPRQIRLARRRSW